MLCVLLNVVVYSEIVCFVNCCCAFRNCAFCSVLLGFRDCVFCQMLLYIRKLCVFLNFVELPKCFFLVKCFRNVVVYLEIVFFLFNFVGFPKLYVLLNVVSFDKCCVFCKMSLFISEMSYFVKCCLNY